MRNVAVRAPWMSAVVVAAVLGGSLAAGSVSGRAYATPVAAAASVTMAAAPTATGPDVAAVHRSLGGLSCTGRSFCIGVGPYSIQNVAAPTFSQIWNGKAWLAPASVPSPSGGVDLELVSVSCANDKNCIAVGGTIAQGQVSDAWNGSAWRELRAPAGSSQSYLKAVACPAVDRCIAVGTAGPVPEPEAGLAAWAQFWNGASWSKLTPVTPAGSVTAVFSSSFCMAAGQGRDIDKWDGSRWARSSTGPAPVEAFEVRLTGMSCASRNPGTGDTVRLAHERLITAWPRLAAAVDECRDDLLLQARLERQARDWKHGKGELPGRVAARTAASWLQRAEADTVHGLFGQGIRARG
jgi:hypothetical protein